MSLFSSELDRLESALDAATEMASHFDHQSVAVETKSGGSPVTEADHALDELLRNLLPRGNEGWFSEETKDDGKRLQCSRVWVVDPIDGTRDFINGGVEWSISIGLVIDGVAVLGGVSAPRLGVTVLGGPQVGLTRNGAAVAPARKVPLLGARVLASRHEIKKGDWEAFDTEPFSIRPVSSIAWKLAQAAVGDAEATWTLRPKHDWDIAAGVALCEAAGMMVRLSNGRLPQLNTKNALVPGVIAMPHPDTSPAWLPMSQKLLSPPTC